MSKKVTIYTTPSCHFCNIAKDFFKENNIDYSEHDVAKDQEKLNHMVKISGQMGVPVIEIEEDVVMGFNKPIIKKLLGL